MLKKFAFLPLMGALLAGPALAQEASLDAVLKGYYEAVGGIDAWKAVNTVKATGTRQLGPGMEAPFVMLAMRPNRIRVEFTLQGMTGIMAYNGETAWMVMPFMGKTEPEVMPDFMAKEIINEADIDGPLIGYKEDGHQVELLGTAETEGTQAYKLKVTLKNGDVQYWYLDSEYYVPIKLEGTTTGPNGAEMEFEAILSDYKDVGGLMMAHSVESRQKGSPSGMVMTIESVEVNPAVEAGSFNMPKVEKPEQK
ncbi:MAG: hypothetical protein JSU87_00750 [Gemmatimonadota bacterium]|nr:MAG: hypothetical protein JSU87_00750 [Gemmatimonadota bacterium]